MRDVKERVKALIDREDKRNPLTDEQIARQLGIRRDEVALIRYELAIPNSRKRRLPVLTQAIRELVSQTPSISDRELTGHLERRGFDISRFTVQNVRKSLQTPSSAAPAKRGGRGAEKAAAAAVPTFANMIGADGSLKAAIQQVQAAVLYPPAGLHTLLFGPTGVGKSRLAEAMYHFAVEQGVLKRNAPFVEFNCADYAKNPQLLLAQLFGYVKGAFTGADSEKEGLVDRAKGGILFLDEIHRLPPEGQENLFTLIDKGVYRRLGEVDFRRKADVLLVGATTESPESSLLLTFRRRIPMAVELPSLAEWSKKERLQLIFHFLNGETARIGRKVSIERDVVAALLSYDCPGNAGQLQSDIRVLLARGFLRSISQDGGGDVYVEREDLPPQVMQGLTAVSKEHLSLLNKDRYLFVPGLVSTPAEADGPAGDALPLYDWIAERYRRLKEQGHKDELIQLIIGKELGSREGDGAAEEKGEGSLGRLAKIVGENVVRTVEQMLWIAEKYLALDTRRLSYVLAIHLRGLLDRLEDVTAADAAEADDENRESVEYQVAREMAEVVDTMWGVRLPAREIALIAAYLRQSRQVLEPRPLVGVVVASYGQVAKSMADIANRLFERRHVVPVELHWEDDFPQAVARIGEALKQADQGAGVILLADMGTLFLHEAQWTREFGVYTKVVTPVTTAIVAEVMRKCLYTRLSVDEIAADAALKPEPQPVAPAAPEKPKAVITVCLTGEGAARKIAAVVQKYLGRRGGDLRYLHASSHSVRKLYKSWRETHDILAVVGTVNPMIDGVPYISMDEVIDETGLAFLKRLLAVQHRAGSREKKPKRYRLRDLVHPDLLFSSLEAQTKEEVIEALARALVERGYVKREFAAKVREREALGPTHLDGRVAIPHADASLTLKPAVAVARLRRPVEWEKGVRIGCVVLLAVNEHCQPAIEELFALMSDPDFTADCLERLAERPATADKQGI